MRVFCPHRAYSARDVCIDTVSEKMLAGSTHDRNNHQERDYIAIARDVHTAFLHAGIDQELFDEFIFIHVDDGLLFGPSIDICRLIELLSNQVLMRIVGRLERQSDQIFFFGRVIARTARGYSVEATPKYIRDEIAVLGLEDSRPVATSSIKRTPTTESLVKLENEKRAGYKTALGKLLYMCQERADIMYSVKETARKIPRPAASDETNMKRIAR